MWKNRTASGQAVPAQIGQRLKEVGSDGRVLARGGSGLKLR